MWRFPARIIAHRCGGTLSPENTLLAAETGLAHGFRAMEFDVMLTQDNVPILMHDPVLRRTAPSAPFVGTSISEITSADLLQVDVGSWLDSRFSHARVPRFEDVILFCMQNSIHMNIEIKPVPGFELETARVVAELALKYFPPHTSLSELPMFSSFSFLALTKAMEVAPHIPRGFLIESLDECDTWKQKMHELKAVSLNLNHKLLTSDQVKDIKSLGYYVFCFTVNSPDRAGELIEWGVDSMCTDRLDLFQHFDL